ncbi:MAG: dienelactone hydrolase family protein [Thaumarchaeota archaeon]|nr:MAG: dienelactone hydrolase family protein [Nitrososphaerota archaeon]
MSRLALSIILSLLFSSMILTLGFTETVKGESNSSVTNVSKLGSIAAADDSIKLQNKTVEYYQDSQGYLVYPLSTNGTLSNKLPAVIMVHEWWGLNENIKNMANILARQGFVVLAADLYKGEVANTPQRAAELVQSVRNNQNISIANLQSAVKYLGSLPNVDGSKIVSMGWCFGGGQSLQLALNSQEHPLAATVIYYGTPLVTNESSLSEIKWPVLGIFGDKDQAISLEQINLFRKSLDQNGITNEIHIYKGVGHAFANPSGDNYAPKETQDAWQKTLSFLKKYVEVT